MGPASAVRKRLCGGPKSLFCTANASPQQGYAGFNGPNCWAESERELVAKELAGDW